MQPPPGYEYASPRRGMPLWAIIVISLTFLTTIYFAVIGYLAPTCDNNLRQLSTAIQMYAEDYDERLPIKSSWGEGLRPYVKKESVYTCPSRPLQYGYAFNSALDQQLTSRIPPPKQGQVAVLFESNLGLLNGSDPLASFVKAHWSGEQGFGRIAFLDGHVKGVTTPPSPFTGIAPSKPRGQK